MNPQKQFLLNLKTDAICNFSNHPIEIKRGKAGNRTANSFHVFAEVYNVSVVRYDDIWFQDCINYERKCKAEAIEKLR